MVAGRVQVIAGVARSTSRRMLAAALVELSISLGTKTTESNCPAPAASVVPLGGVYTNEPGTLAAAFSCEALRGVPKITGSGVIHVSTGVARATVRSVVL